MFLKWVLFFPKQKRKKRKRGRFVFRVLDGSLQGDFRSMFLCMYKEGVGINVGIQHRTPRNDAVELYDDH